jgi:hypothetical protein
MSRHQGTVLTGPSVKGAFRVTLADDSWWWSPGMYMLHGYRPGQVPQVIPSTRLMLAHLHPADRRSMNAAWAHLIADGELVALRFRIVGADGVVRPVFALASTGFAEREAPSVVTGVLELDTTRGRISQSH